MAIFILGRLIFGAYFVISGFNHFKEEKSMTMYAQSKRIPYARFAVLLAGVMLIAGGLGFLFNHYIQESIVVLLIFLVPTTFIMHSFWTIKDPMHRMGDRINFMKNMALIGALLMML